jgi:hypothetical protein
MAEVFRAPVEAARAKARQIIREPSHGGYTRIIEGWHQMEDGKIEFTIRAVQDCNAGGRILDLTAVLSDRRK